MELMNKVDMALFAGRKQGTTEIGCISRLPDYPCEEHLAVQFDGDGPGIEFRAAAVSGLRI
jgi:hypothetical protein